MAAQRMSEAEVSLRLAIHLVLTERVQSDVVVALDGAQVKIADVQQFDVSGFLAEEGWRAQDGAAHWKSRYVHVGHSSGIVVHAKSGIGDVTAKLRSGQPLIVEAKKGTLTNSSTSAEYPLLREALGQLLTLDTFPENAVLAVAVPHGERFVRLAERWRQAPLIRLTGIRLLTVARNGDVQGW